MLLRKLIILLVSLFCVGSANAQLLTVQDYKDFIYPYVSRSTSDRFLDTATVGRYILTAKNQVSVIMFGDEFQKTFITDTGIYSYYIDSLVSQIYNLEIRRNGQVGTLKRRPSDVNATILSEDENEEGLIDKATGDEFPEYYDFFSDSIQLYPTPGRRDTIMVKYYRSPHYLGVTGDSLSLSVDYRMGIVYHVSLWIFQSASDLQRAGEMRKTIDWWRAGLLNNVVKRKPDILMDAE